MITVLKTDGTVIEHGNDNSLLTLEWMQKQVGGYIEVVYAKPDQLIVNEEGKIHQMPHNSQAQDWWDSNFDHHDVIVGDAILLTPPNKLT